MARAKCVDDFAVDDGLDKFSACCSICGSRELNVMVQDRTLYVGCPNCRVAIFLVAIAEKGHDVPGTMDVSERGRWPS